MTEPGDGEAQFQFVYEQSVRYVWAPDLLSAAFSVTSGIDRRIGGKCMNGRVLCQAGLGLLLFNALPASAHHSFAMFDNRNVVLTGTVRSYEWTNPHTWLWLYVTQVDGKPVSEENGQPQIWGLEGTAPGELVRQGRSKDDFKAGVALTVTIRPLKSGQHGGSLGKVVFADGRVIGGRLPGAAPPGGPPGGSGNAFPTG